MSWLSPAAVLLVARILLVVMFPFSAFDKILHWGSALKQANSSIVPGGAALLAMAIVIELAAPACIVAGWHGGIAALVLAAFCAVTAVLYHPFWTYPDFWTPKDSKGRRDFWDFLKNFGLAGGLLLAAALAWYAPVAPAV